MRQLVGRGEWLGVSGKDQEKSQIQDGQKTGSSRKGGEREHGGETEVEGVRRWNQRQRYKMSTSYGGYTDCQCAWERSKGEWMAKHKRGNDLELWTHDIGGCSLRWVCLLCLSCLSPNSGARLQPSFSPFLLFLSQVFLPFFSSSFLIFPFLHLLLFRFG